MGKKTKQAIEVVPHCVHYTKGFEHCPSSKTILQDEDFQRLLNHCVCPDFKKCDIYLAIGEKAA
ncbi:MAG: hypothetical protein AAF518_12195 [Spirochaetota bacterium]